jgi:hypothetical protein
VARLNIFQNRIPGWEIQDGGKNPKNANARTSERGDAQVQLARFMAPLPLSSVICHYGDAGDNLSWNI